MTQPPPSTRRRIAAVTAALALAGGVGVAALVVPSSAAPIGSSDALKRTVLGPNLIKNSGFSKGLSDWSHTRALTVAKGGVLASKRSAALEPRSKAAAQLRDKRSTAPQSVAGREYQASVFVRATRRPVHGQFRLAEWGRASMITRTSEPFVATVGRWSRVTFVATANRQGDDLVLSLTATGLLRDNSLKVDRVRLHPVRGPKHTTPSPSASPSTTSSTSTSPSPSPSPSTSSASPTPTATQTQPSDTGDDTLFGASVYQGSRTWTDALDDSNEAYGGMEVVRVFYTGLPSSWPGRAGDVGGSIVVSFKALPSEILSGRDDALLSNWFRTAPKDREIWWSYWHEPEDDIADGRFTAQQYRDAYRHIAELADAAGNRHLHNTLILMCWTLNPASGRTFTDYFPGKDAVDTLGWDCYSVPNSTTPYARPADMYSRAISTSNNLGMDFGIAETGSLLAGTDPDGAKRATWLRSIGSYLENNHASFACYFDSVIGGDFRLLDAQSRLAWKDVVTTVGSHNPV
jgi:hypothetical protein